jgi:nucleoside-diphosphate kinase
MAKQATLVIIKPDAIKRQLAGAVLSRLEPLGLEIIGAKVLRVSRELAEQHYLHIRTKPFFEETVNHLRGLLHDVPAVLALVYWGEDAVERVRRLTGATNPEKAEPDSIRGALGRNLASGLMENVLHASSDVKEAEREIRLWFKTEELLLDPYAPQQASAR